MEYNKCDCCPPWGPPGEKGDKGDKGCKGKRGRSGKSFVVLGHVEIEPCEVVIELGQNECNDTYILPEGTKYVLIRSVGAGGSGFGALGDEKGGGGGSGGYSECWLEIPDYIKSINVTNGIGGSPILPSGGVGNDGQGLNVYLIDEFNAFILLYTNPGGKGPTQAAYGGLGGGITPAPINPLVVGFTSTEGNGGCSSSTIVAGNGGVSLLGSVGIAHPSDSNVRSGKGGAGGSGGSGPDSNDTYSSGAGGNGVAWITAYGLDNSYSKDSEE